MYLAYMEYKNQCTKGSHIRDLRSMLVKKLTDYECFGKKMHIGERMIASVKLSTYFGSIDGVADHNQFVDLLVDTYLESLGLSYQKDGIFAFHDALECLLPSMNRYHRRYRYCYIYYKAIPRDYIDAILQWEGIKGHTTGRPRFPSSLAVESFERRGYSNMFRNLGTMIDDDGQFRKNPDNLGKLLCWMADHTTRPNRKKMIVLLRKLIDTAGFTLPEILQELKESLAVQFYKYPLLTLIEIGGPIVVSSFTGLRVGITTQEIDKALKEFDKYGEQFVRMMTDSTIGLPDCLAKLSVEYLR
jgi:hypothetical protein